MERIVSRIVRATVPPLVAAVLVFTAGSPFAQPGGDQLAAGFRTPPDSARPRTWWHWTMSNVTKEGITRDLKWMKRVGIGGFMLADVNAGGGQTVEGRTHFGTPQWFDAVLHAAAEADRLGLEMAIFSSPGWSETGGPWVKPHEAMKKLVWSETTIAGPQRFSGILPDPPRNNGQIRDAGAAPSAQGGGDPTYYADSAVLAYRTPAAEMHAAAANPIVTTNDGPVDGTALLDDQLSTRLTIPAPKDGGAAWVQFDFPKPFTARAFTIGGRGSSAGGIPVGRVLAGDDCRTFRTLVTLPGTQLYRQGMVRTFAFAPTTATCYRIEMTGAPLGPAQTMSQAPAQPAAEYVLSEAVLHGGARVERWEEKAGFSFLFDYERVLTPAVAPEAAVRARDVIDLTSRMKPDGTLVWDAPAGNWTVLRLGYSLTGAKNRPATPAGSGFEADKLDRAHMEAYYRGYFDPLQKALGPLFGRSLRYVMMDSWEAGTNNWTDRMIDEFRQRRGYDPLPYLPVLTGKVVDTADVSDRFAWDFRRTLADMWADHHYGTMADLLRQHGIGIYAEAAGVSLEMPEDTLLNKSRVEIPMGEFWVRDLHPRLMYLQDVRGAASASHVYGKTLTATESFTGGGYESPFTLKKSVDYWFAQGTNRIVFHTSAHQPLDTKPGNTMVGTHLHRNITWAERAAPFVTYLARASYMLQQGLFVADVAYLLNEGAPSTPPIWGPGTMPPPPEGYDYDFVNADVLLNRMSVAADGRIALPDGMSYRVLVLPDTSRMRPELLRKIRDLVVGGAVVVGRKPERSPSLADYPAADEEVRMLAAEIWGDLDGAGRSIRRVGKGAVYWGWPLERLLEMEKIGKDVEYARPQHQFGRAPGRPAGGSFEVFDRGTPAFDGKALRRQVTVYFTKEKAGPKLDLLLYLPAGATKPVPLLLNISFTANNLTVDDPGVKPGAVWNPKEQRRVPATGGSRFGSLNVAATLERGFGIATFNYADVDPDAPGAVAHGIRAVYLDPGETGPGPDEWGSIAAWAWGISRVVDYLETDRGVDATRIAITGVSRLGKTVLWAGAADERIAAVIASCSGEGGAALSRRTYGETVAHLVAPTRYPYQFAGNYAKLAADPNTSPVDANLLVALIAPRALLLQTGDTDYWSDPKGEFLAALSARPVFDLFGEQGPATDAFPPAGHIVGDPLAYYMHAGGHGMVPGDLAVYLDFLEKQFSVSRQAR